MKDIDLLHNINNNYITTTRAVVLARMILVWRVRFFIMF